MPAPPILLFAVYDRGPVSAAMQDLLLHHDQCSAGAPAGPPAGAQAGPGSALADALAFGVRFTIACPKLGLALDMRRAGGSEAALGAAPADGRPAGGGEPPEVPVAGTASPPLYVILALQTAYLELDPAGELSLQVDGLCCGSCDRATAPVDCTILSAPSTVCHRVCKAAEFFRYAVAGSLYSGGGRAAVGASGAFAMQTATCLLWAHGWGALAGAACVPLV